jgi:hypothetical protein
METSMKNMITVLLVAGVLMGCEKDETTQLAPGKTISTSFSTTDTLGNPSTFFRTGKPFYLNFQMTNKTGTDQNYTWTGPVSEIYITRNDTIISRQYSGYVWTAVFSHDILKDDSTVTNRFLGPFNPLSSVAALMPGNYAADVSVSARFDNAEIERPQRIQITIIDTSQVVVRKPNIYLYPKTTRNLSVALEFPLGGSVLQSIPLYSGGWNVSVEPSGKIDRQYDYLFYESKNPDTFQYTSGWVVGKDTLASFFSNNLLLAGFSQREKSDFIEYWIPRLVGYPYYIIYPQFADEIGKVIRLKISEQPDNMLRLFYVIQGTNDSGKMLPTASIPQFERNGFVVTEWGVILK